MASKGQKFRSYSVELKQAILKKHFDGIGTPTSEHYIHLVEEWVAFYNSTRLKNRNLG